jgi:hypothetical protein
LLKKTTEKLKYFDRKYIIRRPAQWCEGEVLETVGFPFSESAHSPTGLSLTPILQKFSKL